MIGTNYFIPVVARYSDVPCVVSSARLSSERKVVASWKASDRKSARQGRA